MTTEQRDTLGRWADLVFKIGTPIGFALLFYLKGTFATHEEVSQVADQVYQLKNTLTLVIEQNKTNERQDKRLDDHEARLRQAEARLNRVSGAP